MIVLTLRNLSMGNNSHVKVETIPVLNTPWIWALGIPKTANRLLTGSMMIDVDTSNWISAYILGYQERLLQ